MASKIKTGIVSNFAISIEGNSLVINYRAKEAMRFNLKVLNIAFKDLSVYLGEIAGKKQEEEANAGENKVAFTAGDVTKFIQVFQMLQKKYTGRYSNYPVGGRYYPCFEKATAQAIENKLTPEVYLQFLINHYSRRNSAAQVAFPYPNQLSGEYAQQVIVDETGRGSAKKVPDGMRALKLAQTNRYLNIDKDQAYQEAYHRCKAKKHTRFDVEYIKARQTQLLGQPKEWLLKREQELNDKEAQTDGNEE